MSKTWIVAAAIAAAVLWLTWLLMPLLGPRLIEGWTLPAAAQWGDTFGALNALFGALGFTAVVVTLYLQRKGLREQLDDQHRERFESSFFQLLHLMVQMRDRITYSAAGDVKHVTENGLDAISLMLGAVRTKAVLLEAMGDAEARYEGQDLRHWYDTDVLPMSQNGLGPYFRVMYNMLDRVRRDKVLSDQEKNDYGNLLRGQLNDDEIVLVGINGLSPISKDFRDLIVRFRLLKYARSDALRSILERSYPPEAFKGRDSCETDPHKRRSA